MLGLRSVRSCVSEGKGRLFRAGSGRVCGGVEVLADNFVLEQFLADAFVECE